MRKRFPDLEEAFFKFYDGEPSEEDLNYLDYRSEMDSEDPPLYIYNPINSSNSSYLRQLQVVHYMSIRIIIVVILFLPQLKRVIGFILQSPMRIMTNLLRSDYG